MERLFVYGTLAAPNVQRAVMGRVIAGVPDTLAGYHKDEIRLGLRTYPIARPRAGASIAGLVLEVTPEELALCDRYETDAYQRVRVTLASGLEAWVYRG